MTYAVVVQNVRTPRGAPLAYQGGLSLEEARRELCEQLRVTADELGVSERLLRARLEVAATADPTGGPIRVGGTEHLLREEPG